MTDRYPDNALDLGLLPAPAVIKGLSYDTILAERLTDLGARFTAAGLDVSTLMLKSEPSVVLQGEDAFRELLDLQAIDDAARAVMILYARGTDQDVLYALLGIRRLVLVPAVLNRDGTVATAAVMEDDDGFMLRAQVALDASAPGLTGGGYAAIALRASPEVKRVSLVRGPEGTGIVHVVLQGRLVGQGGTANDGSVSDAAVRAVAAALSDDWSDDESTGSQLTDIPMVTSAVPFPYDILAMGTVPQGPAYALVEAQSAAALTSFGLAAQLVGGAVPTDALIAAGRVAAMAKFTLVSPPADVVCDGFGVPWCRSVDVKLAVAGASP